MDRREHWNASWTSRAAEEVSWFQELPEPSLELVKSVAAPGDAIVDVGGGASGLAGALVAQGYGDVTVLEVSSAAIVQLRKRLGDDVDRVRIIVADALDHDFSGTRVSVWHDRAVFHFLTEADDRARYRAQLEQAVVKGGYAVVGTFAPDGPERCSGLPVRRYDAEELVRELGTEWSLVRAVRHEHRTPSGAVQPFTFVVARR